MGILEKKKKLSVNMPCAFSQIFRFEKQPGGKVQGLNYSPTATCELCYL